MARRCCLDLCVIKELLVTPNICSFLVSWRVRLLQDSVQCLIDNNALIFSSEPQSGFKIAFNMFDTDGNQKVDKAEFLVVSCIIIVNRFLFKRRNAEDLSRQTVIDVQRLSKFYLHSTQIRQLLGGSFKKRVFDDDSKEVVRFGFVLVFRCFSLTDFSLSLPTLSSLFHGFANTKLCFLGLSTMSWEN